MSNRRKAKDVKELETDSEEGYTIRLATAESRSDGLKAVCTCGWSEGPTTALQELGAAAAQHAVEAGHLMRRHHVER